MSDPTSPFFDKEPVEPEDANGDGVTDRLRPSVAFILWVTDAATVFSRGVLAGLFPAFSGGLGAIIVTDSSDLTKIATNGGIGVGIGLLGKGLERLHFWQTKAKNLMPNPARTTPHDLES